MKKKALVVVVCATLGVVLGGITSAFGAPMYVSIPVFVGCVAGGLAVVSKGAK